MSKAFTREDDGSHPDPLDTPRRVGGPKRPITAEGRARLERELSELTAVRGRAGHPSLNSSLKDKQTERRILLLSAAIEDTVVADTGREAQGRVTFGAWVGIEDENGAQLTYRLVGPDEANAAAGSISVESPLARALIGRSVGEWVTVDRPRGSATYRIASVSGEPPK
jgi:transcription elongation factor GreB